MNRLKMLMVGLFLSGCATHKVSLRELQEYDRAIQIAESRGIDTKLMHEYLAKMFLEYIKDPGEDPYVTAARDSANAQGLMAASTFMEVMKPEPYQPPMSPGEFFNGMGR